MLIARLFVPFALGYFMSYLFRVVNAVAGPRLAAELDLSSGDLGLLTSVYFLAFASAQIPIGIFLDRFGPRRVEAILLLVAAGGAAMFAAAQGVGGLIVGRALIGLGVASCLMAALKAYSEWFPTDQLSLVNGAHMAVGGLGALAGGVPVEMTIEIAGWRPLFLILASLCVAVSAAIFFIVPRRGEARSSITYGELFAGLRVIVTSPAFLRIAPLCVLCQATAMGVHTLWAGPWLQEVGGLTSSDAASVLSWMAAFLTAGFLGFGYLGTYVARRGHHVLSVAIVGGIIFLIVHFVLIYVPPELGPYAWFAYAFTGSTGVVCFAALAQVFSSRVIGRVNTAMNFMVFIAAFATQWLIGEALDALTAAGLTRDAAYDRIFMVLAGLQIVALVWVLVYRRTDAAPAVAK